MGDCYSTLGAVHALWHPLPGRFKDYIATPKANLYQSLHTTVIGPDGRPIEIQIRTQEMHEASEYGIAAHWLYKKDGNSRGKMSEEDKSVDSTIRWVRQSLNWAVEDDIEDAHEYLDDLKVDLFEHEIFVFTPKGEVLRLRCRRGTLPPPRHTVRAVSEGRPVYLVPRENGGLVLGATQYEAGFDTAVTARGVRELIEAAERIFPGVAEYELLETAAGLRAGSADNMP